MSTRRRTFDDRDDAPVAIEPERRSHRCPANGCPNAAAVSLDGGARWACYAHAKAPSHTWPEVTQGIRAGWPATANWNHPEKVAHEAKEAAKRRAALPQFKRGPGLDLSGVADLLGPQP